MSGKPLRFRAHATLVLGLLPLGLCGQQLPLRAYTTADGLPSNEITTIVKDSHGYLWFCTPGGLARFDGYQFTNYGTLEGLPSARVDALLETRAGDYWIGTGAGLCHFAPKSTGKGRFMIYRPEDRPALRVLAIHEDRAGNLWIGTKVGLYRFQLTTSEGSATPAGKQSRSVWRFEDLALSPDDRAVNAFAEDSDGILWIGSDRGLFRRHPDGRIDRYWMDEGSFGLGRARVNVLVIDRQRALWVATWGGLWKIPAGSDPDLAQRIPDLPGRHIWSMVQAGDGLLWSAIESPAPNPGRGYLCAIDEPASAAIHCYSSSNGIAAKVTALGEDREGDLWLGTYGFGALRKVRHGFMTYPLEDSTDVLQTRAGEICAGRRLDIHLLEHGGLTEVRPRFSIPIVHPGWGGPQSILQDRSGDWWFPTGQGLFRFGPALSAKSLAGLAPKAVYTKRDGLASDEAFRLFEDREGNIWVGTYGYHENGVSCWERSTGKWHHYYRDPSLPETVRHLVSYFGQDDSGAVWIGFWGGELARFRHEAFQFFGDSDGWIGGGVYAIHEDPQGTLWIGSSRGLTGIPSPDATHPRFLHFSVADGLSGNDVASVISDNIGRLYIATRHGVDQIDVVRRAESVELGRVRHYTTAEGLNPGVPGMAYRDRDGNLWFQESNGISELQPEAERAHSSAALIQALRIAGAAFPISELGESAIYLPKLKAAQNNVQIEYSGLNFAPGGPLRYQYMLEGADHGWSEPTLQRSVNYANLAPGHYRFLVRVADADSSDGNSASSVIFAIDPPLWHRWWFLMLLAAGILAAGTAFYRMRLKQLLELERVRTRIATDLHDDIGSNLSQIAILSEVALQKDGDNTNHEALTRIAEVSRETVHSMSDIVWAVDPEHDHLSDLVNRMHRFANDVLGARAIKLQFQSSGEQEIRVATDVRREIFLIFKECVNNAVRHSGCDTVDIGLLVESGRLELTVADNGRGLDPCISPSGHGLISIRKRAQRLAGDLEVVSGKAGGVVVRLRMPLSPGMLHV